MIRQTNAHRASVHHTLLTDAWTADVQTVETGIREFATQTGHRNDYRISMFELADDPRLHVNVIHAHETKPVKGWAGPGVSEAGFVHNRTFDSTSMNRILLDIRRMVSASRR